MTISLRPDLRQYVEEQVKAGRFADANEAVNAALDLLMHDELDDLRREVQVGIDAAERGEYAEFTADDIIAEGHARLTKNGKRPRRVKP
jgi:putative addiction module CopG family antidote